MFAKLNSATFRSTYCNKYSLNLARKLHESHYDILQLPNDCSSKDIKESFIKLSKEHHPDKTSNKNSHKKFVKIAEAYNVLSKPDSRRLYDLGLIQPFYTSGVRPRPYSSERPEFYRDPWTDPTFWQNGRRRRNKNHEEDFYYGINGLKKMSNGLIFLVCVFMTSIGIGLQMLAIKSSFTLRRDELIRRSLDAEQTLAAVRAEASKNKKEKQIELLKQKYEERLRKD